VFDASRSPLVLFDSEWTMKTTVEREKEKLTFFEVSP
jgi:peptide chain release factor 3